MKLEIKVFAFVILAQLVFIKSYSQEEPVSLKTLTGEIKGTLSIPSQTTPCAVILIIAGSGPTNRDCNQPKMTTNSYKYLSDTLRKLGIASLRFDKRGVGESLDKNFKEIDLHFDDYVADVKAWIELLSTDKRFSNIIVAGHSEGSLIGMIAVKDNKRVKGFISIAGPGLPADMKLKEQLNSIPVNAKVIVFSMIDTLKAGNTISDVPESLYSLFRQSVQPYLISWFKYNPQDEIKQIKIPILIIQGSTDIQVSENDANLLAKANPAAKEKIIKNMNHILKICETNDKAINYLTYNKPELPINKDFVTEIVNFIKDIK